MTVTSRICRQDVWILEIISPVATEGFGGLSPPNKAPSPQIEIWNIINQWICVRFECQAPPAQALRPPEQM